MTKDDSVTYIDNSVATYSAVLFKVR